MSYKKKNFLRDLEVGNAGQAMVITQLIKSNIRSELNKTKAFDLEVFHENLRKTLEIKYDIYAARSGNIAIEYFNPKTCKPSGITATEADFWVHVLTGESGIWITSVSQLKSFIDNNKPHKVIEAGGDNNAALYLYKKEVILPVFNRLDSFNPEQVVSYIFFNGGALC